MREVFAGVDCVLAPVTPEPPPPLPEVSEPIERVAGRMAAPPFAEATVLAIGAAYEDSPRWFARRPSLAVEGTRA